MSLLDEAKKVKIIKRKILWNKEHFALTEAWIKDEISLMQIAHVIKSANSKRVNQNNAANMVMYCIRQMRRDGKIKII